MQKLPLSTFEAKHPNRYQNNNFNPQGRAPQGKQHKGRPKTTWWRTVTADLAELGLVWAEAESITRDRVGSRDLHVVIK